MRCILALAAVTAVSITLSGPLSAQEVCQGFGPQTPRDISSALGSNPVEFPLAPASQRMNLCNIHSHTNAEHKGPGYSSFAGATRYGGYQCNETASLTAAELAAPAENTYGQVKPGDSIEVHWVYTSCDVAPGPGLGACLSDACANPTLRVEAQVFLVVNDPSALDFTDFDYDGTLFAGRHQPKALPAGTGTPVLYTGSTTGPDFDHVGCSPLQVTWSVRPTCAKVDINSLNRWAENNAFNETASHGIRQLLTAPELLSPIAN